MTFEDADLSGPDDVRAYLVGRSLVTADDSVATVQLSGGVSGRVFRVDRLGSASWVVKQALPQLQVEVVWRSDPSRIHVEAEAMRWLNAALAPGWVPRLVYDDPANHVIVMEAVPEPCPTWKSQLLQGRVDPTVVARVGSLLARIHFAGYRDRDRVSRLFGERRHFEELRLDPYYRFAGRVVPEVAPFLEALCESTLAQTRTFVHGDFSPKNLLLNGGRVVLVDHEVAHLGDPAFDLGFAMAHFLGKFNHLRECRPVLHDSMHEFWRTYRATVGRLHDDGFEDRAVSHSLACVLARAVGKSPLEYLEADARERQRDVVVDLMAQNLTTVSALIDTFVDRISA